LEQSLTWSSFLGHERDFQRSSRRDGSTYHGHWRILNQTCRTEPSVVAEGGEDLALELSGLFDLYLWRSRTQRPGKNTTEFVHSFYDRFGTLSCPSLSSRSLNAVRAMNAGAPSCRSEARCPVFQHRGPDHESLSVALHVLAVVPVGPAISSSILLFRTSRLQSFPAEDQDLLNGWWG